VAELLSLDRLFRAASAGGVTKESRRKNTGTSLGYLARAFDYGTAAGCPASVLEAEGWWDRLERYFERQGAAVSAHTRRNTRNNLLWLCRRAEVMGLLRPAMPPRRPPPAKPHASERPRCHVTLELPTPLHDAVQQAASASGVSVRHWCRRAVEAQLPQAVGGVA
jgi:hypothetical protein